MSDRCHKCGANTKNIGCHAYSSGRSSYPSGSDRGGGKSLGNSSGSSGFGGFSEYNVFKELYQEYDRQSNDPEFQLKIRETYQRAWSTEVSFVIEKYTKTKECEICMEDRLEFLFVKCSVCIHDICGSCYPNLKKKCPFCRTKF